MNDNNIKLHTIATFRGKEYKLQDVLNGLLYEYIRYNQIIKEVREVINQNFPNYASCIKAIDEIEEILDKVNI